uniref:Uncharacterized protein n=1 Tax=Magallana gigas TaxID=29159 RepID=A0A8W8NVC7_MAGGI
MQLPVSVFEKKIKILQKYVAESKYYRGNNKHGEKTKFVESFSLQNWEQLSNRARLSHTLENCKPCQYEIESSSLNISYGSSESTINTKGRGPQDVGREQLDDGSLHETSIAKQSTLHEDYANRIDDICPDHHAQEEVGASMEEDGGLADAKRYSTDDLVQMLLGKCTELRNFQNVGVF